MALKEKYLSSENLRTETAHIMDELFQDVKPAREYRTDISSTALLVIDLQRYFLEPENHAYIPSAGDILGNISLLAGFFRKQERPVIFTRHLNNDDDAGSMAYWWSDLIRENTRESELISEIKEQGDIVMIKSQFDAFYKTNLQDILLSRNVVYPVICGVMTNLCCETTTRSAFVRGFRPVMPIDATEAYNREYHLATFRNLCYGFMPLLTTAEVIQTLQ
ncbi:MAG: isochorismatase family protein [Bacteroidales bacterium]|nr:isochorismatase family protein [Bacteroidales bacterium]